MKKKMGRPIKAINFNALDKLCEIQCTEIEVAGFLGISVDTLERRVIERSGFTFAEYFAQKRGNGKISLRRRQWQKAMTGNPTMLIWLGKQYLDQKDKLEHSGGIDPIQTMTPQERSALIVALIAKRNADNS